MIFCKPASFFGVHISNQETYFPFIFRLERVDHPLECTAGRSTWVMNLDYHVFSLADRRQVIVFFCAVKPDPTGKNKYKHTCNGDQPTNILPSVSFFGSTFYPSMFAHTNFLSVYSPKIGIDHCIINAILTWT